MNETQMYKDMPRLLFGRGYYVDFDQFAHLLKAIREDAKEQKEVSFVANCLGIATAKASGLIYLARGFHLLERDTKLRLTHLGHLISEHDPFFDDRGTLWFLHYVVSSEPRQLVWNRFANILVPRYRFTLQEFRAVFTDQRENHAAYSAARHISKETLTVIDSYIYKNFSRLGYLCLEDDTHYILGHRELISPLILGASITRYRDRHRYGDTAVSVTDLLAAPNSPGIIFQLSEERFRSALEQLRHYPGFSLESRADLDQVRLNDTLSDVYWMEQYYVSR
jgi:Protein of unknown function (DUF4007)